MLFVRYNGCGMPAFIAGGKERALLVRLMVSSFAPIGAALAMKFEDVFTQNRRRRVRLLERGQGRCPCPAITALKNI